jgi:transposase
MTETETLPTYKLRELRTMAIDAVMAKPGHVKDKATELGVSIYSVYGYIAQRRKARRKAAESEEG